MQQEVLASQSESMIDLQFEPQAISVSTTSDVVTSDVHMQPKIITVKVTTLNIICTRFRIRKFKLVECSKYFFHHLDIKSL